jgi:hypothetical protein
MHRRHGAPSERTVHGDTKGRAELRLITRRERATRLLVSYVENIVAFSHLQASDAVGTARSIVLAAKGGSTLDS